MATNKTRTPNMNPKDVQATAGLMACPFCGHAEIYQTRHYANGAVYAQCEGCGAECLSDKWNNRAPDADRAALIEELGKQTLLLATVADALHDFVQAENTSVTRELMTPAAYRRFQHARAVLANHDMSKNDASGMKK